MRLNPQLIITHIRANLLRSACVQVVPLGSFGDTYLIIAAYDLITPPVLAAIRMLCTQVEIIDRPTCAHLYLAL